MRKTQRAHQKQQNIQPVRERINEQATQHNITQRTQQTQTQQTKTHTLITEKQHRTIKPETKKQGHKNKQKHETRTRTREPHKISNNDTNTTIQA